VRGEPNGLTFANVNHASSLNVSEGMFGGMFGTAPCVDYWGDRPTAATALPTGEVKDWPSGKYYVTTGNISISSASGGIPAGKKIELYVSGNVAITGNITYNTAGWNVRTDIPSFRLVVNGVIYIDNDVTELDGLYAAVPDSGYADPSIGEVAFSAPIDGTIATCSRGFASYNPRGILDSSDASMPADCAKRLTFNGSVAGLQIWLLRTGGSVATNAPAEVFNYRPETWLAPSSNGNTTPAAYDSIIGLPPIL
jgi:hypothetical protein